MHLPIRLCTLFLLLITPQAITAGTAEAPPIPYIVGPEGKNSAAVAAMLSLLAHTRYLNGGATPVGYLKTLTAILQDQPTNISADLTKIIFAYLPVYIDNKHYAWELSRTSSEKPHFSEHFESSITQALADKASTMTPTGLYKAFEARKKGFFDQPNSHEELFDAIISEDTRWLGRTLNPFLGIDCTMIDHEDDTYCTSCHKRRQWALEKRASYNPLKIPSITTARTQPTPKNNILHKVKQKLTPGHCPGAESMPLEELIGHINYKLSPHIEKTFACKSCAMPFPCRTVTKIIHRPSFLIVTIPEENWLLRRRKSDLEFVEKEITVTLPKHLAIHDQRIFSMGANFELCGAYFKSVDTVTHATKTWVELCDHPGREAETWYRYKEDIRKKTPEPTTSSSQNVHKHTPVPLLALYKTIFYTNPDAE